MNGEAVRLTKGAFDSKKVYSACPEGIAARFRAEERSYCRASLPNAPIWLRSRRKKS